MITAKDDETIVATGMRRLIFLWFSDIISPTFQVKYFQTDYPASLFLRSDASAVRARETSCAPIKVSIKIPRERAVSALKRQPIK